MVALRLALLLPALALALATTGSSCKRKAAEIDGIGDFSLSKSTMEQAGACGKRKDFYQCLDAGRVKIGGQAGVVDLYFRDKEGTATEILVVVNRCRPEPIERELRKELGQATAQVGGNTAWVGKKATIIARLPAEKGVCEVTFLHPSETERIAELSPPGIDLTPKQSN